MGDDNAAFLEATLPAMDVIYRLARRSVSAAQACDVEDLVQETYLHALRGWHAHRHADRVEAWMATICLNLVRSQYRREQRRPAEVLQAGPGGGCVSAVDPARDALLRRTPPPIWVQRCPAGAPGASRCTFSNATPAGGR